MARKATLYDVAELAGVSIATVSFAFTKPDRVKSDTLAAVMAAADQLGYVPSAAARGLARGRTGAIGLYAFDYLLDSDATDEQATDMPTARLFPLYADEVQRGVQVECRRRGYALMIGGTRAAPHLSQVIDVAGRVDGLIAFAGAVGETALKQVSGRIPVVELGGEVRVDGVRTIYVDNRQGMADLTSHLVTVHGHRRFGYLGELGTPEFRQRFDGFTATLRDAGLPVPPVTRSHPGDDPTAAAAVRGFLERGDLPDVLVCDTDQSALAAIDALRAEGLTVPGDVAVTGFDGIVAGELLSPALTTVRQPMEAIGRLAVRILVDTLAGVPDAHVHEPLRSVLVVGGTCGCPPPAGT
ncbi:LacI family transcriptional regulator [Jiangella aurantiaca]|uniref:LacI family transcriptional regulator n=1 Tax=Jiangella aurantiaca TaxID=2530373 RepID=A0A4R5AQD9_9ACTN|nr:LacI family DNA-binding transcriptional regulator [Jiangella aurantiaca]TDD72562.1 LacI family transcriptional regulator [Jiangella aurantiaca]